MEETSSGHNDHIKLRTPKSENSQYLEDMEIGGLNAQPQSNYEIDGAEGEEFWPLSGKPRFNHVLGKTNIKPLYTLLVPSRMKILLPPFEVPVILAHCGKNWATCYKSRPEGASSSIRWKEFVIDNNLKEGDACVFELDENTSTRIRLRVQILRGDFPSELMDKRNGSGAENPVIIDL